MSGGTISYSMENILKFSKKEVRRINIKKGHGSLSQKLVEKPALYLEYLRGLKYFLSSMITFLRLFAIGKRRTSVLQKTQKAAPYFQTRTIVLEAFEKIGLPRNKFRLHSLRSVYVQLKFM